MSDEKGTGNSGQEWTPERIMHLAKRTVMAASHSANEANLTLGLIDEMNNTDPNLNKLLEEVLASVDCLIQVNRYLISLIESPGGGKVLGGQ